MTLVKGRSHLKIGLYQLCGVNKCKTKKRALAHKTKTQPEEFQKRIEASECHTENRNCSGNRYQIDLKNGNIHIAVTNKSLMY